MVLHLESVNWNDYKIKGGLINTMNALPLNCTSNFYILNFYICIFQYLLGTVPAPMKGAPTIQKFFF